jgi:sulfate adenylyltransferase subunit 1 (EFTu-like GTPase family)
MVNIMSLCTDDIAVIQFQGKDLEVKITDSPRKYRAYGRDQVRVTGRTTADDVLVMIDADPTTEIYVK